MTMPQREGAGVPPRSATEIKKQLADLDVVRRAAESFGTPDFASRVGMEGLRSHQASLEEELRAAEMLNAATDEEPISDGDPVSQNSVQVSEEHRTLSGILVGGSIETARFELRLNDEVIQGKVSEAAKAQLTRMTFGAQVEAEVRVTTLVHEGAFEPKTSYFLDSIRVNGPVDKRDADD